MKKQCCRVCGSGLSRSFCDLGISPLANSYVPVDREQEAEKFYPLHAYVCETCHLVQLGEFESPSEIFSDYAYFSSFSKSWLQHAETYVAAMIARFGIDGDSKVVEVASNDGYLLQYFVKRGIPVLGVEPAANVAEVARANGIPSEVAFFGNKTAEILRESGHAADLMAANNVLAHVPDILDFVSGFAALLKPNGVATFEFPHLLRQIEGLQFDQIYHEHFSYLSLLVVTRIAGLVGLRVFDVEHLPTHGGSLRVFMAREAADHITRDTVNCALDEERRAHLSDLSGYEGFGEKAVEIKLSSLEFFVNARRAGKTVCGYGAAAKGNTFLNYVGVGVDFVQAVADRSPHKQNTLLPGSRIPVVTPETLIDMRPDYLLILPWNLEAEIASEMSHVRDWGGKFVRAIPSLKIF